MRRGEAFSDGVFAMAATLLVRGSRPEFLLAIFAVVPAVICVCRAPMYVSVRGGTSSRHRNGSGENPAAAGFLVVPTAKAPYPWGG